jgi:hypothetical protein
VSAGLAAVLRGERELLSSYRSTGRGRFGTTISLVGTGLDKPLDALAQGDWPPGNDPGSPALPNTGELVEVNSDGTVTGGLAGRACSNRETTRCLDAARSTSGQICAALEVTVDCG